MGTIGSSTEDAPKKKKRQHQAWSIIINIETKISGSGISRQDYPTDVSIFKPDLASVATDVDREKVKFCDMWTAWELKRSSVKEFAQSHTVLSLLRTIR
jgi:hypothetical protein